MGMHVVDCIATNGKNIIPIDLEFMIDQGMERRRMIYVGK
ncbi:hypothetical protein MetfoDRAFT_0683 [Methanotorris formicicus Mc-S-70]|uniref:Uncharacterized protein n=2 Tax=Methanotorris formicicus TaxID=213185 RepID=H1KY10_9EURY|nr:hypothetical protein MetfoDRAFT_0683 [Methanotorris formicicus Mc-S-70]